MYQEFFGLKELPFELTSNPKFLFLTASHREALSNLEYGLSARRPMTVLIGEAGTGKTTLLRAALESDRCRGTKCIHLSNPTLTRDEFIEVLADQFGLGAEAAGSKTRLLSSLEAMLRAARDRGEMMALVVDEAQSLSAELLEEIRLLANIETPTEKLLPLVLAGQPSLAARLNEPGLRQLKQRVALRCQIAPLDLRDTAAYIAHRIVAAGGTAAGLFTREAVTMIHTHSAGIPRTINVMCDNTLLSAFAIGQRRVDRELVEEVARDFDLGLVEENSNQAQAQAPAGPQAPGRLIADRPATPVIAFDAGGTVVRRGSYEDSPINFRGR